MFNSEIYAADSGKDWHLLSDSTSTNAGTVSKSVQNKETKSFSICILNKNPTRKEC
jgi:hypothetical protein